MRLVKTILTTTIFSLLFSACSVSNFLHLSNENDKTTSTLQQLINNSLENSPYTITTSTADDKALQHTINIDRSRNIHIIDHNSSDTKEYIFTSDNQIYYQKAGEDSWLKLTLGKTTIAKDLLRWNVLLWSEEQLNSSTVKLVDNPQCNSCDQYIVTSGTLSVSIAIDLETNLITTVNFSHEQADYSFEYIYEDTKITIPDNYQEYSIPSDPSQSDIELIQEIYGTN